VVLVLVLLVLHLLHALGATACVTAPARQRNSTSPSNPKHCAYAGMVANIT
jgi:hypothetical protein